MKIRESLLYSGSLLVTYAYQGEVEVYRFIEDGESIGGISETTMVIPSGKVSANLSNFPTRINLADLPLDFWINTSTNGENIRIYSGQGIELAYDLTLFDRSTQTGELFFKAPLVTNVGQSVFFIRTEPAFPKRAVDAPLGRNAVWSDYEAMFVFESLVNRTGKTTDATFEGNASIYEYELSAIGPDTDSHQGIAVAPGLFITIDTNAIRKYDRSWNLISQNLNPIAASGIVGVNHLGDGTIVNGELFIPLEVYPNNPYDNQHIVVFDVATLTFQRSFNISAQGHEVSSIAYDPVDTHWYITEYNGPERIHEYNNDFTYVGFVESNIDRKQGIEIYNGEMYVSSSNRTIYKVDRTTQVRTIAYSEASSGIGEGIAFDQTTGELFFVIDSTIDGSRTRTLVETGVAGLPGWLNLNGGNARTPLMPLLTTWTMGVSAIPASLEQGALLSYSEATTANTSRATLAQRSSPSQYGIWNSTDTWLSSATVIPAISVRNRLTHTQSTTVNRKLYVNGVLEGTDVGTAQRPVGANPYLYIGAEDTSYSERFVGGLNYAYLRNGELSADWLRAEYESWETEDFYYIGEPVEELGDLSWSNVVVRMPMDDTDNIFRDVSTYRRQSLRNGLRSSGGGKFSGTMRALVTGAAFIQSFRQNNPILDSPNWTIEFWITSPTNSQNITLFGIWDANSTAVGSSSWRVTATAAGRIGFSFTPTGSRTSEVIITNPTVFNVNVFNHIAISKDAGTIRLFVNGVLAIRQDGVADQFTGDIISDFTFFGEDDAGYPIINTYSLDDLRITSGVCRYITDASFPVPLEPYPITGTVVDTVFPQITQLGLEILNKNAQRDSVKLTQAGFEILRKPA